MPIRHAIRALLRRPGFSLLTVGALALGVAGTTAVYSLVHNVLIEGLPYPAADRLVTPDVRSPQGHVISLSIPNYRDWVGRSRTLESYGASAGWSFVRPLPDGAEILSTRVVLGDFFGTLGLRAARGRLFAADETGLGRPPVAVLGHAFWQRELGGRDVIGEPLVTDEFTATIVGVLPPGAGYPAADVDAYVPMGVLGADGIAWDDRWSSAGTRLVARLAPGVSFDDAQADLSRIAAEVAEEEGRPVATPELRPLEDLFFGDVRRGLWLLMGAVALLLLIACANVANLALARGEGRARELAVRSALGAGRGRLTAILLTESALLAGVAGGLGVALAAVAIRALPAALPLDLPGLVAGRVALNAPVVGFALAVTTLSGLLFGLVPALRLGAGRGPGMTPLRKGAGQSAHRDARRLQDSLVVVQVALSLMLLVGAGLLTRSLARLSTVEKGFVAGSVVTARLQPPGTLWPDVEQRWAFYDALEARLVASPAIESAAATLLVPLSGRSWERRITPEGGPLEPAEMESVLFNAVDDDYFRTLGIPLVRGRGFGAGDDGRADPVAIIDATMAEAFWPGQDPIGRRITFNRGEEGDPIEWLTVVGVVPNVRHYELAEPSRIQVYVPVRQVPFPIDYSVALKVAPGAEAAAMDLLRRAVADLAPGTAMRDLRPLADLVADRLGPTRSLGTLTGIFAAFAVLLAALGIFGVLSLAVARRRREIGVRMAIGATPRSVLGLVVRHGLLLTALGAAVGTAGALAASGVIGSLLYDVRPIDPVVYGLGVSGILALAAAAALGPAVRASRLPPARVLREE